MSGTTGGSSGPHSALLWPAVGCALVLGLVAGLLIDRRIGESAGRDAAIARVLARLDAIEAGKGGSGPGSPGYAATAGGARPEPMEGSALAQGLAGGGRPPSMQQLAATQRQRLQQFESRFAADARDAAAGAVELDMLKAMANAQLAADGGPDDPDVQCRRHGCRVSGNFRGSDEAMQWSAEYVTLLGRGNVVNAQPVLVANPDGSVRLRLFASRVAGS